MLKDDTLEMKELKIPELFKSLGLICMQAHSSKLQELYFGETKIEKLNVERLREFTNNQITQVNLFPHPFG